MTSAEAPASSGWMPRILVVEDEVVVRMVAVDALANLGFQVEEAATAAEAVSKMQADHTRIHGVLIDVGLPDGRGDALAADLRAIHAQLPIIIATGYGAMIDDHRFSEDRRTIILGKPYDETQLEAALRGLGLVALNAAPSKSSSNMKG